MKYILATLATLFVLVGLSPAQTARTDQNGLVLNYSAIKPPDLGCQTSVTLGTGVQGSDCSAVHSCPTATSLNQANLESCGNLYGAGLHTTDPNFPGVTIVRFTDFNDEPTCSGPEIGPGGSAEEAVFSHDDQLIQLTCAAGGQEVFKVFNPTTLAPGGYCINSSTSGLYILSPAQGGFVEAPYDNVTGTETWIGGIGAATTATKVVFTVSGGSCTTSNSAITTVADFIHVLPCWNSPSTCSNYPGTSTSVAGGTIILPTTNNADKHLFELWGQNSTGCTTGTTQPTWSSVENLGHITPITDGGCTWIDIQPPPPSTGFTTGKVAVDEIYPWVDGSATGGGLGVVSTSCTTNCAQGGVGSIHVVNYDPTTLTYYLWELATGNMYKTVCSPDYTCSSSSTTTYMGNAVPLTEGVSLFHNVKHRCSQAGKPCYIAMNQQTCALGSTWCANGLNSFMWQVGAPVASALTFFNQGFVNAGHKAEGFRGQVTTNGSYNFGASNTPWWVYNTYNPIQAPSATKRLMILGHDPACTPSACPIVNPMDNHESWTGDNISDTAPTCAATDSLQWWPLSFPYQFEIYCVATDGSNTVWRQGFDYNTANGIFNTWANIGSKSGDNQWWGQTTDWWCTLGESTGLTTNLCALPWQGSTTYAIGDQVSPGNGDNPYSGGICKNFGCTFQVTACSGTLGCVSGATNSTKTTQPAWCGTFNCTLTDNGITWTNVTNSPNVNTPYHMPYSSVFLYKMLPMVSGTTSHSSASAPTWIASIEDGSYLYDPEIKAYEP